MVISRKEMMRSSSACKLRDFSDEAGPLSEGSFGANEAADERLRYPGQTLTSKGIKSSDEVEKLKNVSSDSDPLGAILNQKFSKNKSQGTGRNKMAAAFDVEIGAAENAVSPRICCSIGDMADWERRDTSARNNREMRRSNSTAGIIGTLTAEYDFEGEEEKDLGFKAGQKIHVLKVREKDWWVGVTEDGRRGLFPINFMKRDEVLI
mmetsp:Transcript_6628/g.7914  ORF Transcript_6628/g.7914 Transcript_6628/m.7914 type:complete len:207 (-) Transcript_6628:93-713(-)